MRPRGHCCAAVHGAELGRTWSDSRYTHAERAGLPCNQAPYRVDLQTMCPEEVAVADFSHQLLVLTRILAFSSLLLVPWPDLTPFAIDYLIVPTKQQISSDPLLRPWHGNIPTQWIKPYACGLGKSNPTRDLHSYPTSIAQVAEDAHKVFFRRPDPLKDKTPGK